MGSITGTEVNEHIFTEYNDSREEESAARVVVIFEDTFMQLMEKVGPEWSGNVSYVRFWSTKVDIQETG
ncbi:hypothetical protein PM082_004577 [Marasmius tenuissimus]|nr:hypothetical protein PM082_004577 [Marasmius tenuissimus]